MPQVCKVCRHAERAAIDRALSEGKESYRDLAGRFGTSKSAMERHRAHVTETVALAVKAEEATRADDLLGILREAVADARRLRQKAEDEGDYRGAIGAVKALSDVVAVLARVGEKLAESRSRLTEDPEWIALRERIFVALEAHPEALRDVMEALSPRRLAA